MLVNGLESAGGYPKNAEKMLKMFAQFLTLANACLKMPAYIL